MGKSKKILIAVLPLFVANIYTVFFFSENTPLLNNFFYYFFTFISALYFFYITKSKPEKFLYPPLFFVLSCFLIAISTALTSCLFLNSCL